MSRAIFSVVSAGPHVTIQDGGRPGLMRFGVPASGPMDPEAFAIANAALGNLDEAPGLEISLAGVTLDCVEGAVTVAVAGGGFQVRIDTDLQGSWTVATLRAGSRLTVTAGPWGSWTYLTFAGALQANRWLGSVATHGPSGLGGGKLVAGQQIVIADARVRPDREGVIPCPVTARPRREVKVVLGPQERFFPATTIDRFLSSPFALTDAYDRMGVRLAGPPLPPEGRLDMPSEPIVRGSIQVSGEGHCTVLLADHQTTGGYPKIATIVSDHINGLVQLRSRSQLSFVPTTPSAAVQTLRAKREVHDRFMERLRLGGSKPSCAQR